MALSAAGEQFVTRLTPALRDLSSALESVNELRDVPSGNLRITAGRGAVHFDVIGLIARMRERYPDVSVEVTTQERLVDIVAEGYDAGIRLAEAVPQDMIAIPFGPPDISLAVVATPAYFARRPKPKSPSDLAAHECIRHRMASGGIYRWDLEKRGREVAIEVNGALTFDDEELILQAALAGVGLAFTSLPAALPHLRAGRLVRVLEDWTPPFPGLRLFHPSGRLVRAALRAFIDIVREHTERARTGRRRLPSTSRR